MKTVVILVAILTLAALPAFAQMEQGDREVQAAGSIYTVEDFTLINIVGTYGYYYRHNVQIGVGPSITRIEVFGFSETTLGASFFGRYFFPSKTKTVPYLVAQWYQFDFSPPDPLSFTDASYLQGGAGFKYFVNEYIAWDVSANLGFGLGGGSVALLIVGGVSAFF